MVPGTYRAKAIDVDLGMTLKGNPQIAVAFEIVEGEYAGRTLTWYGYFTEGTQKRTIESLRHCGWQGNDLSAISVEQMPDDVLIVVTEEPDQLGKLRLRVNWVNRLGAGTVAIKERMDPTARKAFAERMRGLCMAVPASARALTAPTPTANPTVSDDDLPF